MEITVKHFPIFIDSQLIVADGQWGRPSVSSSSSAVARTKLLIWLILHRLFCAIQRVLEYFRALCGKEPVSEPHELLVGDRLGILDVRHITHRLNGGLGWLTVNDL
jgi:hypothetical protein